MAIADAQVRRLTKRALRRAVARVDDMEISFERIADKGAAVSYLSFSADDAETGQRFAGVIYVAVSEAKEPIDALSMRVLGRVP